MKDIILSLEKKAMELGTIELDDAIALANLDSKQDILKLYRAADSIRDKLRGKTVDLCSIINAKSGSCPEDCKFCAQSAHYNTEIDKYKLVSEEKALEIVMENEKSGINRIALVTSGKGLKGHEFEEVLQIYRNIKEKNRYRSMCFFGNFKL